MRSSVLLLCAVGLGLGGCNTYTYRGPNKILSVDAAPVTAQTYATAQSDYHNPKMDLFVADYENALALRKGRRVNGVEATDAQKAAAYKIMMQSGFMYNYAFCSDYFDKMAIKQRNSKVLRRILPPISTLITGIVGLNDFSSNPGEKEDIVQGIAIGSAFSTSLLDVYDEQFLYGTDNIESVEDMTLKAVSAHAASALAQSNPTYESAIQHLIDNQNICQPQYVLKMARSAITNADVTTRQTNVSGQNSNPGQSTGHIEVLVNGTTSAGQGQAGGH